MVTVFDIAAYILKKTGPISAMKLQKLVFYAQAWSLVWDEKQLFSERFEAWANGPVCPDLYSAHRGEFLISEEPNGDAKKLCKDAKNTIKAVVETYGNKSANWLSALTHSESPWVDARVGVEPGERSNRVITHGAMAEYYGNL